ncbi:MAG: hypothetical protein PUJ57_03515 [Peptoniphilaceae bacterium]|nr:hypothetical protein [Peptoniphilaceae bacterium]MDY6085864.1 hypothetical protein [Peptoniphilaceae bacterium]
MKALRSERGSVEVVEGSILFPIAFLAVFLLLFLALFLYRDATREAWMRRALTQPPDGVSAEDPRQTPTATALEQVDFRVNGLFFRTMHAQSKAERSALTPLRFFDMREDVPIEMERTAVWSSSTRNLWRWEAINGFARHAASDVPSAP